MNEEEKQAIKYLNKYSDTDLFYEQQHYNYIKILLNLIENQQKEIEEKRTIILAGAEKVKELEKEIKDWKITKEWVDKEFISKSKIKNKIEKLYEEKCTSDDEMIVFREIDITQNKISVLEELLEETNE